MKAVTKLAFIPLLFLSIHLQADDVTQTLSDAIKSYKSGEYTDAVEDINYALQLIQQKKSEGLSSYLPDPLEGWSAKKAESVSAGSGMFGGGIGANRTYKKDHAKIKIEILTDSPILQSMMGLFTNPLFAASDGGKLERIKRQKAIIKYQEERQHGEITIVVDKRFLVRVEGYKVTLEDLKAYAKAIDYKKLKKLP